MRKKILLVEDTTSVRELVGQTLKEAGYDVLTAVDGNDALQYVEGHPLDLVITDLNMPNRDGISLIEYIRSTASHRHTPILLFSTESMETKARARQAGATGMIEKPMEREQMLLHIKKLIR